MREREKKWYKAIATCAREGAAHHNDTRKERSAPTWLIEFRDKWEEVGSETSELSFDKLLVVVHRLKMIRKWESTTVAQPKSSA